VQVEKKVKNLKTSYNNICDWTRPRKSGKASGRSPYYELTAEQRVAELGAGHGHISEEVWFDCNIRSSYM
jgi:hypothetical protein